jgi:hypothetical protein
LSRLPTPGRRSTDRTAGAGPNELSETPLRVLRNRRFLALWLAQVAT